MSEEITPRNIEELEKEISLLQAKLKDLKQKRKELKEKAFVPFNFPIEVEFKNISCTIFHLKKKKATKISVHLPFCDPEKFPDKTTVFTSGSSPSFTIVIPNKWFRYDSSDAEVSGKIILEKIEFQSDREKQKEEKER